MTTEQRSFDTANGAFPYLFFPAAGESAPLVLFLHGARDRGNDLNVLLKWGLPLFVNESQSLPYFFAAPQLPADQTWVDRTDDVIAFLDHLLANNPINPSQVIIAGFSLGTAGTWHIATTHTDRFAGVVAVSGRVPQAIAEKDLANLKDIPVQVFQCGQDANIPIADVEKFVENLRGLGVSVNLTVFPDGDHFIADQVYSAPDLQQWFISQTRRELAIAA
jgi:predicted peptidase